MYNLWTFFNKIFIITIPNSQRILQLKDNLRKTNINNYNIVEFAPAKKMINDGGNDVQTISEIYNHNICDDTCQNIAQNHIKLIKEAYKKKFDNILILEDHALFDKISPSRLFSVISWLTKNKWDMFYFGYCPWPIPVSIPITRHIVRVFYPYCTHCYALNRSGIVKIIKNLHTYNNEHIDNWYSKQKYITKYAIFPAINFQSSDPALFKKAIQKIGVNISFKNISKILEVFSLILPLFIIFIVIFMLYKIKKLLL